MLSPVHSSAPNEAAPAARGAIAQLGRAVTRSYWQRSGNMPLAPATPNDLPASASHVIIGGGFAGGLHTKTPSLISSRENLLHVRSYGMQACFLSPA